jgi:hypothetical protein
MAFYMDTTRFVKSCMKAVERLAQMPDGLTKSSYTGPDILSNARAMLAGAEAARAAALSVIEQVTPKPKPPEVHNHYNSPRPSSPHGGASPSSAAEMR